ERGLAAVVGADTGVRGQERLGVAGGAATVVPHPVDGAVDRVPEEPCVFRVDDLGHGCVPRSGHSLWHVLGPVHVPCCPDSPCGLGAFAYVFEHLLDSGCGFGVRHTGWQRVAGFEPGGPDGVHPLVEAAHPGSDTGFGDTGFGFGPPGLVPVDSTDGGAVAERVDELGDGEDGGAGPEGAGAGGEVGFSEHEGRGTVPGGGDPAGGFEPAGLAGGGAPLGVAEFTDPEDTAVGGDGCEMVGDLGDAVVDAAGAAPAAASDEDAADDAAADDADDEFAVGPVGPRVGDVRFLTTGGGDHLSGKYGAWDGRGGCGG